MTEYASLSKYLYKNVQVVIQVVNNKNVMAKTPREANLYGNWCVRKGLTCFSELGEQSHGCSGTRSLPLAGPNHVLTKLSLTVLQRVPHCPDGHFLLSLEPRPSSLRSARPSWRGPGKTAGHLGNCKVDGSVRSQFSPFFTLTVARVPCYDMSRAYITGLQLAGFCEHRQSRAVLKKVSDRQAVGLHLQSNSRYTTCSRFEVTPLVSFWSRSCVISVSTDSQKKLKKKSRSTKTS